MIKTIEAKIDKNGQVSLLEPVKLDDDRRALVTILDESPVYAPELEPALLSEASLAEAWNTSEEDAAWQHLDELPALEEES